ncbi:hypothetical protein ACF1BE_33715 [Streptomyces sp. NPDC014991]|uniref:hypothetical protein n=1 Tax=Streptomyces sp. NPDC014991 TaxID=3364935 RepID=UPI0036F91971
MQAQQYMVVTDQAVGVREGVRQQAGEIVASRPDVHPVEAEPDVQRAVLNRQLDVDAGIGRLGGFGRPPDTFVAGRDAGGRGLIAPPVLHDVANGGGPRPAARRSPYDVLRVSPNHARAAAGAAVPAT